MPNVLSPRDLVSRPDNMDKTVQSSCQLGCRIMQSAYTFLQVYWYNSSNRKTMNRNWSNQKANPALKTKAGNK